MDSRYILPLALGCCWLFSPEALVITGNSAGQLGWFIAPLLALAALTFAASNNLFYNPHLPPVAGKDFAILQRSVGRVVAAGLILSSWLPLAILAATALLVTCGYTFNEVFFYWFPNFGFAFLLLGLLILLQLFPERTIHRFQLFFICLAGGGLLFLILNGLIDATRIPTETLQYHDHFSPASMASLLLLFVGSTLFLEKQHPFGLLPVIGFLFFALWSITSLSNVAPDRLISSTIPYMTAARKILGDTGRLVMGMIAISGTCATVTGLILHCRQKFSTLVNVRMAPPLLSARGQKWIVPPLIGTLTAVFMATGLGGEEILEVYLRGALLLWLLGHTSLCFGALVWIRKDSRKIHLPGTISTLVLISGFLTLLLSSTNRKELYMFLLSVLLFNTVLAACLRIAAGVHDKQEGIQRHISTKNSR